MQKDYDYENMENWSEEEMLTFIRARLTIKLSDPEFALIGIDDNQEIRLRFDMSGYESRPGQATIGTQAILNRFVDLGIYDYTTYLFLDFYKGTPTLYMQYFMGGKNLEFNFSGYSTSQIIYEIFKLTIFSGQAGRRRI